MAEDGYIYVSIMPTTRGVAQALRGALAPEFAGVGDQFARAIVAPLQGSIGRRAFDALKEGARGWSGDFINGLRDTRAGFSAFTGLGGNVGAIMRKTFDVATLTPLWKRLGQVTTQFATTSKALAPLRTGLQNVGIVGQRALSGLRDQASRFSTFMGRFVPTGVSSALTAMRATGTQAMTALQGAAQRSSTAISTAYRRAGESVRQTFAQMRDFGVASLGAVAAAGAAFLTQAVTAGIAYNGLMQTSRAAMTTLLGSQEQADAMLESIREFAMTSPFPRQAFIQGAQQLIAFGTEADRVLPIMGAVQDAVAAAGGNSQSLSDVIFILAQIQSSGRITSQDLMQLGTRGINAAELIGSAMGLTGQQIKDKITEGTLDADTALQALTDGMSERFGGAAENVKSTWAGAMDRVAGATRDLGSIIMEPFVSVAGGGLLVDAYNTIATTIRGTVIPAVQEFMSSGLPSVVTAVGDAFGGVGNALALAAPLIGGMLGLLGPALIAIIGPIATQIPILGPLLTALTGPVGLIVGALAGLIAISPQLRETLGSGLTALVSGGATAFQALVDAVVSSGLLDGIVLLAQGLGTLVSGALSALAPVLAAVLGAVVGLLTGLMPPLSTFVAMLVGLLPALMPIIDLISTLLLQALGILMAILQPLIPVVLMLVGAVVSLLGPLIGLIAPILALVAPILTLIGSVLIPLADMLAQILTPIIGIVVVVLQSLVTVFGLLLPPVIALAQTIIGALMPVIQGLLTMLQGVINFVVGVFTGNWSLAWAGVQQIFQGFVDAASGIITGLFDIIMGIPDFIMGVFAGAGDWLVNAGAAIIQGFIDGIMGMWDAVAGAVGGLVDMVTGFFPNSPAKRGPLSGAGWRRHGESGKAFADQWISGIKDAEPALSAALSAMVAMPALGGTGGRFDFAGDFLTEAAQAAGGAGARNYDITLVSQNDDPAEDISKVVHTLSVADRGGRVG